MRLASTLKYLYLSYFSKEKSERGLYPILRQKKPRKILEIGITTTERTVRMLEFLERELPGEPIRYAAIDLFEARDPGAPKLALKDCHRQLKATHAQTQLIPGDAAGAIARVANSMPNVDLMLISPAQDMAALAAAWFYVPRMLNPDALVLREVADQGGTTFETIELSQIRQWAGANRRRAA